MKWIEIDEHGVVAVERIVAIAPYESAPIRRMLQRLPTEQVIILTSGKRRSAVIIFDSGHVAISAEMPHQILDRLQASGSPTGP